MSTRMCFKEDVWRRTLCGVPTGLAALLPISPLSRIRIFE